MNFGFEEKSFGELRLLVVPQLEKYGEIRHCVTTRFGGVSTGEFESLNMGLRRGDKFENVAENIKRVCSAMGFNFHNLVVSTQTHGTNIHIVTQIDAGKGVLAPTDISSADGLITNVPNIPIMTYFADCVPLIFYDPGMRVIATSHAGWRGTLKGIGEKTVMLMKSFYKSDPKDIIAAIGPSIGPCCFETDLDVAAKFEEAFGNEVIYEIRERKCYVDLWRANAVQLMQAGVLPENITIASECTVCNNDKYFSNRAQNGKMGNIAAIIELI